MKMCNKGIFRSVLLAAAFLMASHSESFAGLKLPAVISDHMVLQAGKPVALWGWADAGDQIKIALLDETKSKTLAETSAVAGADGHWKARLPVMVSGAKGILRVQNGKGEEKEINDVLVGEVWLGSGQSNMENLIYPPAFADKTLEPIRKQNLETAQKEATESHPSIRFFMTAMKGSDQPDSDVVGEWRVADADNVGRCSAVGWYFAATLFEKLHQPVGMIVSAVGSTPVEAWTPREALEASPAGRHVLQIDNELLAKYTPEVQAKFDADMAAWKKANTTSELQMKNRESKPRELFSPTYRKVPVRLYNGMIYPLEPYTLQGVIWYQSDALILKEYGEMMRVMINSWRQAWGDELPFYYVEMNNWEKVQKVPVETSNLGILREQQESVLQLPKTGVAPSIDVGLAQEAHFPVKKPIGQRLAYLALGEVYGIPNMPRSPEFAGYTAEGEKIRLHFRNADGLRVRGEGSLKGFAISGADGKWVWAEGRIEGKEIVVWSKEIPKPAAVRYAWANNPIISVENGAGLPLRPFRTDKEKEM